MNDEHDFHLPSPSVWPAVLGAGIALALFGVVTSYFFTAFGVVLMVMGAGGLDRGLAAWPHEDRRRSKRAASS